MILQIYTLFDPCAAEPSSNYCRTQAGQSEQQPQFLLLMSHISIPRLRHLGSLVVNRYKPHACLVERGNCLPDSLYFLYACVFIDSWNTKGHVPWVKKISWNILLYVISIFFQNHRGCRCRKDWSGLSAEPVGPLLTF